MFIPNDHIPLQQSDVNLDISGVAGFFGGDVAVSAMATVHIYKWRRWLGWYNSPGSYEIAKRYGQLARARFWGGLYPGVPVDPAVLFELDSGVGPKYRAVRSGTVMLKTGHLAHLLLRECKSLPQQWSPPPGARVTSSIEVTVVQLHYIPGAVSHPQNARVSSYASLVPILASATTSIVCAMSEDWLCFSMIVLGMLCSGISCCIIGRGVFTFTHPKSVKGAPPGDGILDGGSQMVILQGAENAVNCVTRGQFSLEYPSGPKYHDIGISSVLLTVQFLAQLLIVPQGTIFGQVMFLCSLAVSWMYNSYLSSLDKESIQRRILVDQVLKGPYMCKFKLGTRTSMVVFVLLVLSTSPDVDTQTLRTVLNDLLPNDTPLWRAWKDTVLQEIGLMSGSRGRSPRFRATDEQKAIFSAKADSLLLVAVYRDARAAHRAFKTYQQLLASRCQKDRHDPDESDEAPEENTGTHDASESDDEDEDESDEKNQVDVEACPTVVELEECKGEIRGVA